MFVHQLTLAYLALFEFICDRTQIQCISCGVHNGKSYPPHHFFFKGGVALQLLIFGPNSPHKSKRQIKTIQPQLNE